MDVAHAAVSGAQAALSRQSVRKIEYVEIARGSDFRSDERRNKLQDYLFLWRQIRPKNEEMAIFFARSAIGLSQVGKKCLHAPKKVLCSCR